MAETTKPGTFIPRDTVTTVRRPQSSGGLNDLLLLASIVLVVASGALGVGVFLYQKLLITQSASKVAELQRAEAAFEPSLISELTRLDDRMHAGDTVLGAHIAPTEFFQALGAATLQTVSFQSLDYEETDASHIVVKMQGVAQSVNSIALQSDLLSKNGIITSPIFSNIARQSDGVHFDLVANVNPSAVSFESFVNGSAQSQSAAAATPSTATAPPSNSPTPSPFGGDASGTSPSSVPPPAPNTQQ